MPRKTRELIDNGIYHVFNRGNDRKQLFCEQQDYRYFLDLLRLGAPRFSAELYHYCLMPNHFHLLLKIQKAEDLPAFMHRLLVGVCQIF